MAPLFTFCTDWIDTKDYLLLATMKYKETFSFVFDLSAFVPLHATGSATDGIKRNKIRLVPLSLFNGAHRYVIRLGLRK